MKLLKEVLMRIKPDAAEQKKVMRRIRQCIARIKVPGAKPILGGSGVKGTWLKDAYDADIFVLFDYKKYKEKSGQLSGILEKYLKKKLKKLVRVHGSRDYFRIEEDGFLFEIIPILRIKNADEAKNITDISPLHAKWVNKHTTTITKDDIRLAKQFCKANNIYGAESHIGGFSGYVIEILIAHYGSFLKLLRNAAKWEPQQVIDAARHYKSHSEALFTLNKAKTTGPLVLIDPVDKARNAAAALKIKKFMEFKEVCNSFIKSPSSELFTEKTITVKELERKAAPFKAMVFEIMPLEGKKDIAGCKALNALERLQQQLARCGFVIKDTGVQWKKTATAWFIIENETIAEEVIIPGPPLSMKKHVENFSSKHKETFTKDKRLYAKERRPCTRIGECIEKLLHDRNITSKVKSIRWLRE